MSHIFISYSRRDQNFVRRLTERLSAAGRDAWVDWEGIAPSAKWMAEIRAAIDAADAFVFVISPDSLASSVCAEEIEHARAGNKRILPIVARAAENVPPVLAEINWIVFGDPDDVQALERLIVAMDTDPVWVSEHTRLTQRARQWELAGREPSSLLRGRDLSAAEAWQADAANHTEVRPTDLQMQYILASRAAQTRTQRRLLVGASIAVVVALSLAVWALIERDSASSNAQLASKRADDANRERQRAEVNEKKAVDNAALAERRQREAEEQTALARARELSALAVSQLQADPEVSLHLALASVERAATPQGEQALVLGLLDSRLVGVLDDGCDVQAAGFGPKGEHVVGRCRDGSVRVWTVDGRLRLRLPKARWNAAAAMLDKEEKRAFVGADDGLLRIYRLGNAKPMRQIGGSGLDLSQLALSPDGGQLYAFGRTGSIQVYESQTLQLLHHLEGYAGEVSWVRFPRDGKRVAALTRRGGPDGVPTVRFWDRATGNALEGQGGQEVFLGASLFSFDGTRLLTKGDDEISEHWSPQLWDLSERKLIGTMARAAGRWSVGTVDAGDEVFMSNGLQHSLEVWRRPSAGTAFELASTFVGHTEPITDVAIRPDDNPDRILTAAGDGTARLWRRSDSGKLLAILRGHRGGLVSVTFSPDGGRALTVGIDGTARVWRLDDVHFGDSWPLAEGPYAWEVSASDMNGRVVALTSPEGQVRVVDVVARRRLWDAWPLGGPPGHPGDRDKLRLTLSPAGDRLLVRDKAQKLARVLDTVDGHRMAAFPLEGNDGAARFSLDGRRLLLLGSVGTLVDVAHGAPITRLRGTRGYASGQEIALTADGQTIFMLAKDLDALFHWHVGTDGAPPYTDASRWPAAGKIRAFALSADGTRVATAGGSLVQVWNVASQRVEFERSWVANTLAFSPDGQRIAAGGAAGGLRIWGVATGDERLARLPWNSGLVSELEFSPDGKLLITNGAVLRADDGLIVNEGSDGISADGRRVFRHAQRPRGSIGPDLLEVVDCVPCQPLPMLLSLAKARLARSVLSLQEQERFGLTTPSPSATTPSASR